MPPRAANFGVGSKVESHFAGEEGNPLNPKGWYPCEITQVHQKSFGVKWIHDKAPFRNEDMLVDETSGRIKKDALAGSIYADEKWPENDVLGIGQERLQTEGVFKSRFVTAAVLKAECKQ